VWKSSQQIWAELHEQAWRHFGGSCRYVVLDNLKEGVLKPDLYEPARNPVYAATLAHYEVVADPARVRDPNRKGTVSGQDHALQYSRRSACAQSLCSLGSRNSRSMRWSACIR